MPFTDYSDNPAANTEIGDGIFIGPNMARNDVRPALQQLAADGKDLASSTLPPGSAASRAGKFLAFDASGNATVATGFGSDSDLRTDLATSVSGAALVAFLQAGTGAEQRTAQDKLRDHVSPIDYGAEGDNATNDRPAIAAAVTANPGRIFSGAGRTYRLGAGTVLPAGFKMLDGKIEHTDMVNTQDDYSVVAIGWDAAKSNTFVPEQHPSSYPPPDTNWSSGNHIVAIGGQALQANTTGRRNTAVGSRALYANTTGYYLTAIGSHALEKNTTGFENIGIGVQAGQEGTVASNGIFIGNAAGLQINGEDCVAIGRLAAAINSSTADKITCVGYRAGYSVTTADDLVAYGRDAGLNATTAAQHTFIGANAGKDITTQVEGTYIGFNAGRVAASNYNTVIGAFAGFDLTSGAGATLVGRRAGYEVTTALDITAIGHDAALQVTTGNNGTYVGRNSGLYNLTGANGTYLGHSAGPASGSGALNNVTCVGYQAEATASNQVVLGNASVTETKTQGVLKASSESATPAGGSTGTGIRLGSAGPGIFFGSGAPIVSAAKGSIYLRTDGSTTNDRFYINTDGATTWTAGTTAA